MIVPQAVRLPNAAVPLEPASAVYEPYAAGSVLVVLFVFDATASAIAPARSATAASANSRWARRRLKAPASPLPEALSGSAARTAARPTARRRPGGATGG